MIKRLEYLTQNHHVYLSVKVTLNCVYIEVYVSYDELFILPLPGSCCRCFVCFAHKSFSRRLLYLYSLFVLIIQLLTCFKNTTLIPCVSDIPTLNTSHVELNYKRNGNLKVELHMKKVFPHPNCTVSIKVKLTFMVYLLFVIIETITCNHTFCLGKRCFCDIGYIENSIKWLVIFLYILIVI